MSGNERAAGFEEAVIYAIGDVHGCDALLRRMHATIRDYHGTHHAGRDGVVVHLGDYVDRGPDSRATIDRLMAGLEGFRLVCLMGNHEAMMLDCLDDPDRLCWAHWLANGGTETLASFGLTAGFDGDDPARLAAALGPERVAWLRGLKLHWHAGGYLFVHAGIRPGVPLEAQQPADLLWIREEFRDSTADHGAVVVHGHTPTDAPERRPNRIALDTGAVFSGVLSAAALAPGAEAVFLQVGDRG
jgi:serine/threonine protein phosphatase 1